MRLTRALAVTGAAGVLLAGAALAASAGDDRSTRPAATGATATPRCSTRVEERNLRKFEERLALLGTGTSDAAYFADNATVVVHGSVPYAGTYTVRDGAYQAVMSRTWRIGASGGEPPRPALYSDCDKVILVGTFAATAAATGTAVDTTVVEVFTYTKNGAILRDDFYFTDTAVVNRALGAS